MAETLVFAGRPGTVQPGSQIDRQTDDGPATSNVEGSLTVGSASHAGNMSIQAARARLPVFKQRQLTSIELYMV